MRAVCRAILVLVNMCVSPFVCCSYPAVVGYGCRPQAEGLFKFDQAAHDVDAVLTRLGISYVQFLCRSAGPSSWQRTVIAIAERMPEVGRHFYETGPAHGIALLASYLSAQVAAGRLAGGGLVIPGSTLPD